MPDHGLHEPVRDASYNYEPGNALAPQPPFRQQPDLFDRVIATCGRAAAIPMMLGMMFVTAHAVLPSALDPFVWAGDAIGTMEAAAEAKRIPVAASMAGQVAYAQANAQARVQSLHDSLVGDQTIAILGAVACYASAFVSGSGPNAGYRDMMQQGCGVARDARANMMDAYDRSMPPVRNPYSRGY